MEKARVGSIPVSNIIFARVLRLVKSWPSLTSLKCVSLKYLDLELDLPSTDIDLAFSTGIECLLS